MTNKLYYKQIPDEVYVLGSVENDEIDMESEDDIDGNQWICAWSHKDDCEDFKKKFDYQRPVSLIPKKYLSSILYNANIDNKIPVTISYLYFNPSFSNITSDKLIKNTGERNVINVISDNDYLAEIEDERDRFVSQINQRLESLHDIDNEGISETLVKHVASMQKKEMDATEKLLNKNTDDIQLLDKNIHSATTKRC